MSKKALPDTFLPLTAAVFHILLSLSAGERHGYALKREAAKRTGGKVNLGPAVLYGSIQRLLDQGLIAESDERPDEHLDDERRRYYRITALGESVLRAETGRLRELVEMAELSMGPAAAVRG